MGGFPLPAWLPDCSLPAQEQAWGGGTHPPTATVPSPEAVTVDFPLPLDSRDRIKRRGKGSRNACEQEGVGGDLYLRWGLIKSSAAVPMAWSVHLGAVVGEGGQGVGAATPAMPGAAPTPPLVKSWIHFCTLLIYVQTKT